MAWTVTRYHSVFGNKRVAVMKLTADAQTQTVETGLSVIEGYSLGYGSMTTITGKTISINSSASGVQAFGSVGFSGFASGDDLYVTVYGR